MPACGPSKPGSKLSPGTPVRPVARADAHLRKLVLTSGDGPATARRASKWVARRPAGGHHTGEDGRHLEVQVGVALAGGLAVERRRPQVVSRSSSTSQRTGGPRPPAASLLQLGLLLIS